MQFLLVSKCHWIVASNFNVHTRDARQDSVQIYDSLLSKSINLATKKSICSFLQPIPDTIFFELMNIQGQPNSHDCGMFAIACATEIAHERNPVLCHWTVPLMRKHLLACLEKGHMDCFPITRKRRNGLGTAVRKSIRENIYCLCRMPDDKQPMIQCGSCMRWHHLQCVALDEKGSYDDVEFKWMCSLCEHKLNS